MVRINWNKTKWKMPSIVDSPNSLRRLSGYSYNKRLLNEVRSLRRVKSARIEDNIKVIHLMFVRLIIAKTITGICINRSDETTELD